MSIIAATSPSSSAEVASSVTDGSEAGRRSSSRMSTRGAMGRDAPSAMRVAPAALETAEGQKSPSLAWHRMEIF